MTACEVASKPLLIPSNAYIWAIILYYTRTHDLFFLSFATYVIKCRLLFKDQLIRKKLRNNELIANIKDLRFFFILSLSNINETELKALADFLNNHRLSVKSKIRLSKLSLVFFLSLNFRLLFDKVLVNSLTLGRVANNQAV